MKLSISRIFALFQVVMEVSQAKWSELLDSNTGLCTGLYTVIQFFKDCKQACKRDFREIKVLMKGFWQGKMSLAWG